MNSLPCSVQPALNCEDCTIQFRLMCRYGQVDTLPIFMVAIPFFVTIIGVVIAAGFGCYLLGWLAYVLFSFIVWEGCVLCSHCPYWTKPSTILRCHANYGVPKIWKYRPGPMNRVEKIQFRVGTVLLIADPIPFYSWAGNSCCSQSPWFRPQARSIWSFAMSVRAVSIPLAR